MSKESGHESEEHDFRLNFSKKMIALALFVGGFGCIAIGVTPFIKNIAGPQDLANVGFMALIFFFMFAFIKVKKYSRFVFWAACFTLILYTDIMFLFYESLFE